MTGFLERCSGCVACADVCPFLTEFGTPVRILLDRPEAAFYCTSCGRCDAVCPLALSPAAAFFEAKQRLVQQQQVPPPVRKMLDGARGVAKAGHRFPFSFYGAADTVFWPGCGMAANRPGLVRKVRKILSRHLQKRIDLVLDCCYDPVFGYGDTKTTFTALREINKRLLDGGVRQVITGCLNCHKLLSQHLEGIQVVFILEAMSGFIRTDFKLAPDPNTKQLGSAYLHHPCPSSRWEGIRNAARDMVELMPGAPCKEASGPLCCGSGGGLSSLSQEMADRFLDRIIQEGSDRTVITYCVGCQNRFLEQGVEAVHLLEYLTGATPRRTVPSLLRQWVNRLALATTERLKTERFLNTMNFTMFIFVLLFFFLQVLTAFTASPDVLFRENFDSLAQWEPLTFPKIKAHSTYTLVSERGKSILKAESRAAASAIIYRRIFNIYENPRIRWRWKVTQLSNRGNPREKTGDDYPIRIYVMFQYDPDKAALGESLIYGATKAIYGKYPPHSTLNYVWTGSNISERIIVSPYTEKARIVILERGKERLGQWVEESVNVLEDYRKAFGKDPPAMAGLAVMSDTDNTGESAEAYLDFIEAGKNRP